MNADGPMECKSVHKRRSKKYESERPKRMKLDGQKVLKWTVKNMKVLLSVPRFGFLSGFTSSSRPEVTQPLTLIPNNDLYRGQHIRLKHFFRVKAHYGATFGSGSLSLD